MKTGFHVAVLDDEAEITALVEHYLRSHGFRVSTHQDGGSLLSTMRADPADLVLLDLGLPGEDGFSIARSLREHHSCGLIIVTGRGDAVDRVVGLEVGADDYVTKPFDLRELVARVKAVLRRTAPRAEAAAAAGAPQQAGLLRFSGWTLDTAARSLRNAAREDVPLTRGEFELLQAFARNPGRVLSRDFLLGCTRGRDAAPFDRTIDVQVGRLRRKIEANPDDPQLIKSVRGAGYIFVGSVADG
ncbi:MAG: response regulator transcription factor [Bordetella sp.]|nr:response regulator transcription factor [Pseudomonadota bacterium]